MMSSFKLVLRMLRASFELAYIYPEHELAYGPVRAWFSLETDDVAAVAQNRELALRANSEVAM